MDPRTPPPRRLENGAVDLDVYLRRAHRLRSDTARDRLKAGRRFSGLRRPPTG